LSSPDITRHCFRDGCPHASPSQRHSGPLTHDDKATALIDDSLRVQVTIKTDGRFRKHLALGEKRIETLATDVVENAESNDDFEIVTNYDQRIGSNEIFLNEVVFIDSYGKSVKRADAWDHLEKFFNRLKKSGALEQ
jgi:hypothetical protein